MAMVNDKDSELKQLWEEAVNEYTNKSKRGSAIEEWKMLANTDADLNKLIEKHESDFSRFRNNRGKLWGVFKVTMTQLQRLGKVAQAGIGLTPFAPASVIVEAGLFLIDSSSDVSDTYDALEELFKRIRDITDRLDEYLKGNIDHKLRKVAIKLLCSVLDVFCEASGTIKRGRGKEMMRRAMGKENKIQRALDQVQEMVETEINLVTAKTYATIQRIDETTATDRNQQLLRQALYTDATGDNEVFHAGIEGSRIKLSGDWLLKEKQFDKWVRMEFPVLWVLGKPGTGKTYLASRVISQLRQGPNPQVTSYFYIREGMNTQHTPAVILKTIAYHITRLHDAYRKLAIPACKDDKSLVNPTSIWDNLFINPFRADTMASSPLFIVIDGVDEATRENQELLVKMAKSLSDLRSDRRRIPAIQLLLLGRPDLDYDVSNAWRGERRRPKVIYIEPSLSRGDIERFIKKGVQESIPLLKRMQATPSKRLRKTIIKTLSDRSDGMFMLAKLMLAEIKDMNKPELIRDALSKPPSGLDDMFKRVISRLTVMGGFDKEDLNEMILWVSCAKRDLLLGELDLVLKLRDLRQNGIIGLDDELRTRFGSFFSVSHAEGDFIDEEDDTSASGSDATSPGSSTSEQNKGLQTKADTDSCRSSDMEGEVDSDYEGDESESESEYDEGDDEDGGSGDEDEEPTPAKFFVATVKFGHASVGQYFRSASSHEGIGMDINFAQAHITTTCLGFLTGNIPKRNQRPWRQPDLFQYAADHFLDHVVEIQPGTLERLFPNEFKQLSDGILLLLKDQISLRRWLQSVTDEHKFMCQLFNQSTRSRLLDCIDRLKDGVGTDPDARWPQNGTPSSESLLEPFAKSIAEAWLLLDSCDGILAILFLRLYTSIRTDVVEYWTLPSNRPFEHIAESISPEEIRQMASVWGLEITRNWHLALGRTFRRINTPQHLRAAVEEFRQAIEKSDDLDDRWMGRIEQVNALVTLGDQKEALTVASKALESVPAHRVSSKMGLLELIQNVNIELGDPEAALTAASEAWETAPYSHHAAFNMVCTSYETGRFSDAVNVVRSIFARKPGEFLAEMMSMNLFPTEYFLNACAETAQLELARDVLIATSSQAKRSGNSLGHAMADFALARLYHEYFRYDEEPIKIWENINKNYPGTRPALRASILLAPLYFTNAVDSGAEGADSWISKLKALERQWKNPEHTMTNEIVEWFSAHVEVLLGRWYLQRGEKDLARASILPLVKMGIRDLTDKVDSNDCDACFDLGKALVCFGDQKNAEIAYAFATPLRGTIQLQKFRDLEPNINEGNPGNPKPSRQEENTGLNEMANFVMKFNVIWGCDGRCNRRGSDYKSFNMCDICIESGFCDECFRKLKSGNLPFRICSPEHSFFEVHPTRKVVTKGPEGYMVQTDEGQAVSITEWLSMLSRDWLGM